MNTDKHRWEKLRDALDGLLNWMGEQDRACLVYMVRVKEARKYADDESRKSDGRGGVAALLAIRSRLQVLAKCKELPEMANKAQKLIDSVDLMVLTLSFNSFA